jgi:hypothetical protein
MARILCTLLLLTLATFSLGAANKPEPKKILMIGNSLTYTYGIPEILEKFAAASRKNLDVTAHIAGGKSLTWHWNNPGKPSNLTAKQHIEKGGYDLVIVQEYSNGFGKAESRAEAEKIIPEYIKAIRAKSMAPMLYMAHPTAKEVSAERLNPVIEGYTRLSREQAAPCAPVVLAFIRCNEKYPKLALIDQQTDRKYGTGKAQTHQSPFGSYLAACVLYAAIYNQSPVGLNFHAAFDAKKEFPIDPADAKAAQELAWEVWQDWQKQHPAESK